jgi:hypothetical protein
VATTTLAVSPSEAPDVNRPDQNPNRSMPMTRKKPKPVRWPPVGLLPRPRFAELEEHEREAIRSTLAGYEKFGVYGYDEDGRLYAGMVLTELLLAILRHVQEIDGAPARCRNRKCRKGRCHMFIDDDGAGVCPGGIRMSSIDRAGVILSGIMAVYKYYHPAWFDYAAEKDAEAELEERAEMAAMEGIEEA